MGIKLPQKKTGSDRPRLLNAAALISAGKKSIEVQIIDVREAPDGWNAKCVVDIVGFDGYGSMAMNATNTATMIEAASDDTDKWIGRVIRIKLGKASYAGRPVDSLQIADVLAKKALPKKPKDGDVPF